MMLYVLIFCNHSFCSICTYTSYIGSHSPQHINTLSCVFQIIDIGQFWILYQCIPEMPPTSPWLTKVAIEKKITDFVQSKLDPKEGTEAWSTIARMSPGYRFVGSRDGCHHATWKHGICLEWRGGVCFLLKAIYDEQLVLLFCVKLVFVN